MSGSDVLRLATRGSPQAMAQSTAVADAVGRATGTTVTLVPVETQGDRTQSANVSLHQIGGQGVFVKEIQQAVLDGRADLAVHSAKDLPSTTEPGLVLAAFLERRDTRDALIGSSLDALAEGATVATGSVRRRAQLGGERPDLRFAELRGNIGTRLEKVPEGGAIVMAVAALQILELTDRIDQTLDPGVFVPAVGQGCVAVEVRADDQRTRSAVAAIDHGATRRAVEIERAFLAELGAGCSSPVGAHVSGAVLTAFLGTESALGGVRRSIGLSADVTDSRGTEPASGDDLARAVALARDLLVATGG
ncbi:MAG: hydroxymethylbilane synthase [Actinomycetota bacterium]